MTPKGRFRCIIVHVLVWLACFPFLTAFWVGPTSFFRVGAFAVERPSVFEFEFGTQYSTVPFAGPPEWVGCSRRGKLMIVPSSQLCTLAQRVLQGAKPVHKKTKAPIRLEGIVLLTVVDNKGDCSYIKKIVAAEMLGAEGVLLAEKEHFDIRAMEEATKFHSNDQPKYTSIRDPIVDMPVEVVSITQFELLARIIQEYDMEVTIKMGHALDSTFYY